MRQSRSESRLIQSAVARRLRDAKGLGPAGMSTLVDAPAARRAVSPALTRSDVPASAR